MAAVSPKHDDEGDAANLKEPNGISKFQKLTELGRKVSPLQKFR
jgi:hypothetical protein